jgi:drug/metabolite transporter (DMT)-like permease
MTTYLRNRRCRCARCRTKNLLGPAILITLGILFLLDRYSISFDDSWPVLLIVIGMLLFAAHNAPTEGHIQPWWAAHGPPSQTPGNADQRQSGADQR